MHVRVQRETLRRGLERLGYGFMRSKLSLKHGRNPKEVAWERKQRDGLLLVPAAGPPCLPFYS